MKGSLRATITLLVSFLLYGWGLLTQYKLAALSPLSTPPISFTQNVAYGLCIKTLERLIGSSPVVLVVVNSLLLLIVGLLLFRLSWKWVVTHHFQAAGAALIFFLFNPVAVWAPLGLGLQGSFIVAPLVLMLFFGAMKGMENWSTFMRAIVLAITWSFVVWVNVPIALCLLAAMVPWVIYSRRPLPALGIFLTVLILGSLFFSMSFVTCCALFHRSDILRQPAASVTGAAQTALRLLNEIFSGGPGSGVVISRLVILSGLLSPYLFILCVWELGRTLLSIVREHRAGVVALAALLSTVLLIAIVAWDKSPAVEAGYVLILLSLWSPLLSRAISKHDYLGNTGYRTTAALSFLLCGLVWGSLGRSYARNALPGAADLLIGLAAGGLAAMLSPTLPTARPLSPIERIEAAFVGATLVYYLVIDGLIGKGLPLFPS